MSGIKVFYLRNEKLQPVACVATVVQENGDVRYAVSTRNPQDAFKKEIARSLAVGRVASAYKPEFGGIVKGGPGAKHRIMYDIAMDNQAMPLRSRAAARLWLTGALQFDFQPVTD